MAIKKQEASLLIPLASFCLLAEREELEPLIKYTFKYICKCIANALQMLDIMCFVNNTIQIK